MASTEITVNIADIDIVEAEFARLRADLAQACETRDAAQAEATRQTELRRKAEEQVEDLLSCPSILCPAEKRIEEMRVLAYRTARTFEPSMDGYTAAMAVYTALFGPHPGEAQVVAPVDDLNRCAVCGWPLKEKLSDGCIRGNCSMRPLPRTYYAPERALRECPALQSRVL